jgi:TolA-binding protein
VDAGQALTQLLVTPPSAANPAQGADALAQLAVNFSGTAAAQRAQLQAAASYFSLGRYADAQAQFQKFVDAYSTGPLLASANLGLAASLEAQGKLDDAAAAYQKVTSNSPGTASALTAECALGRIAEAQGKLTEAQVHYQAAMQVGNMGGSLAQEAAIHYSAIKARLDQTQKSAAPISQ